MRVEYLSSYDRTFRKLPTKTQTQVIHAIDRLLTYFQTRQRPAGLGLRHLHKSYWEIRAGIDIRILFQLQKDILSFILAGTHDDIRRALRRS